MENGAVDAKILSGPVDFLPSPQVSVHLQCRVKYWDSPQGLCKLTETMEDYQ